MGTFDPKYGTKLLSDGYNFTLSQTAFKKFNPSILGLGDISEEGSRADALAAIFDLEGFTSFSNQIDPHLVVPEYLSKFLEWLFECVSYEFLQRDHAGEIVLWCKLPFYAKFLGDGVLFLWDTDGLEPILIGNIVNNLLAVCEAYQQSFLSAIKKSVSKAPLKLRCGIARGQIVAIGNGQDFVWPVYQSCSQIAEIR